jgi:hypothetical protein
MLKVKIRHPPGLIMPAHALLRRDLIGSSLLRVNSVSLSHSSSCLLIARVALCVTQFQIRKELLYESRFHHIIYRYFCVKSTLLLRLNGLRGSGVLIQQKYIRRNVGRGRFNLFIVDSNQSCTATAHAPLILALVKS